MAFASAKTHFAFVLLRNTLSPSQLRPAGANPTQTYHWLQLSGCTQKPLMMQECWSLP
jgi:hypothetical protein